VTISGRLDDVKVGEVLQFIQLGERSGTLVLQTEGAEAEIEFQQGRISAARSSTSLRLGELLVACGLVNAKTIEEAVDLQRSQGEARVLGEVLVSMGAISGEALVNAVRDQVQETLFQVLNWSRGTFSFGLDEFPAPSMETVPGELLPKVSLDTQMMLFQAAQILDEKNTSTTPASPPAESEKQQAHEHDATPSEATAAAPQERIFLVESSPSETLLIVSEDIAFVKRVSVVLQGRFLVVNEPTVSGGSMVRREPPSLALLDLRGTAAVDSLKVLHERRPETAIIVVSNSVTTANEALRAGAVATVFEEVGAVVACVENISDLHRRELPEIKNREIAGGSLEKLRRLSEEIRDSLLTTSVTLTLMRVLSEMVDRAVLFFVGSGGLVALGAFGSSTYSGGRSLAEITKGARLPFDTESRLQEVIADCRPRTISMNGGGPPSGLSKLLGRPASGQGMLLPVAGAESVILLVYADNGHLDKPVSDVDILELLASQVGVGIENELLRRRLSTNRPQ
jgi:ActR/RegA family two-component response regulator